jgi:SAM-dependent methyltransferase
MTKTANANNTVEPLPFTGERMVPEGAGENVFWEHIYRYRFALQFVRGRRVLDIACGEGYGSAALLRGGAKSVIGVDISLEACDHAARRYGIETKPGDATAIPLPDNSVDLVVSFETIEHVPKPELFLDECRRVLRPGGTIVISTPNRQMFQEVSHDNKFHCSELEVDEFARMLGSRFKDLKYYSQRPRRVGLFHLRGMAADFWPGKKLRGTARISSFLRSRFCAHLGETQTAQWRTDPIGAVLLSPSRWGAWADRYAILPCTIAGARQAIYTVAVGRT